MNKRGYLLLAFGNKKMSNLNYGKLAVCCALSIKTHLKHNHTTIIMNENAKKWMYNSVSEKVIRTAFDNIIIAKEKFISKKRTHFDSPWHTFKSDFDNQNRVLSYQYSPYNETILIDSDYILMNNDFDNIWGCNEDILMNHKTVDLQNNEFELKDKRISNHGIPMCWATAVYFKKSLLAKSFFELVDYIREEYNFFQFLYGFKYGIYRNDFVFSIALHILNGFTTQGIKSLPQDTMVSSYQKDKIAKIINTNEIIFHSYHPKEPWKITLVNAKGFNVHIMNKKELLKNSDKFIKLCMEKIYE